MLTEKISLCDFQVLEKPAAKNGAGPLISTRPFPHFSVAEFKSATTQTILYTIDFKCKSSEIGEAATLVFGPLFLSSAISVAPKPWIAPDADKHPVGSTKIVS
ncbi:hypothetical protein J2046_005987 [Rhizobium petrolearium]|uniref:hypothetical protein n=1 Tax=Neorhizobium petrolearium TaxID=515361 RepID=UPI001AEA779E|nr:hypothetical protein [Neorhizobium petrolearium]MBP1847703.1 hypothetical protein [Neorhizobium petrolearium]